jgi:hypothetical protein
MFVAAGGSGRIRVTRFPPIRLWAFTLKIAKKSKFWATLFHSKSYALIWQKMDTATVLAIYKLIRSPWWGSARTGRLEIESAYVHTYIRRSRFHQTPFPTKRKVFRTNFNHRTKIWTKKHSTRKCVWLFIFRAVVPDGIFSDKNTTFGTFWKAFGWQLYRIFEAMLIYFFLFLFVVCTKKNLTTLVNEICKIKPRYFKIIYSRF